MIPLVSIQDKLYVVNYQLIEKEDTNIELFKQKTLSTNVFRREGILWFCQEIEEPTILENNLDIIKTNRIFDILKQL